MSTPESPDNRQTGLIAWLDTRTGVRQLLREALNEPIPGGARWAYVFGSALLFLFVSQIVTGVFLALYYVSSADHAHTTVAYITKQVTAGGFLRSVHAYGSSAMIIVLILHLAQTFFYGSYKGPRELLWLSGCILFGLVLAMTFTGYLLPWDQKAYFATAVGTNIVGEIPVIGGALQKLIRGGTELGTLTVSRFFVAHVFLVPGAIFLFVALHVFFFRKAGPAGPPSEDPFIPKQKAEMFYPRQVVMDVVMAAALIVGLGLLSHFSPAELGPKANPADTQYLPRPEWYYRPVFEWLRYWHGPLAVAGALGIPFVLLALSLALPFMDRGRERRPWKRPIGVAAFAIVFFSLVWLGALSYRNDRRDPGVAAQVRLQRSDTERFMRAPFEPELSATSLAAVNAALADPLAAKGKTIYEAQSCNACHGDAGIGTPAGPQLTGIGSRYPAEKLADLLRHPTEKMSTGGMSPLDLGEQDMKPLIAYLSSLK